MQELYGLLKIVNSQADWVGLRLMTEQTTVRGIRDEKPNFNQTRLDRGVMVEVLVDGHFGYAGTNNVTSLGIQTATQKAVQIAKSAATKKATSFSSEFRPPSRGVYRSPRSFDLDSLSVKELMDRFIDATKAMKISEKIIARNAYSMMVDSHYQSVSSSGAEMDQSFQMANLVLSATAADGAETQTRSNQGGALALQTGAEIFGRDAMLTQARQVAEEALELLAADNCPTETTDLLLAPDQMTLQVHESIGHPLEYDRILGDERNYAGWSFVKPEDFGKLQYGSPLMNVTFDPTEVGEIASYAFDDAGTPAKKEFLIQHGLLLRGLGGQESQARLNLPGVANFRSASWNRAPIDRMANINLEPGSSKLEDIIASVERGVLMMANKSWSIDDYRNKFQFGCEYAKLIENGKLTKTLKNPNYRGITVPFWTNLKAVSQARETYGTFYCGKGEPNQVIRVGHRTPYCLFSNVEVFGAS